MTIRIFAITAATAAVIVTVLGCGGGEPQFDQSTKYSPSSLTQEFAFRYKSLNRSKTGPEASDGVKTKSGAIAKAGATTKAAQPTTLEELVNDVMTRAALIPGMSHSEACKKVAEEVAKNPSFTDSDKKIIADKLAQVKKD